MGDNDIAIGPAFLVDQLLALLDREIDRARARERTRLVLEATKGIAFAPTARYARTLILGSRQSFAAEQRAALSEKIRELESSDDDDEQKLLALGFEILNVMSQAFSISSPRSAPAALRLRPRTPPRRRPRRSAACQRESGRDYAASLWRRRRSASTS